LPKFQIYKDVAGKFRFRVRADNNKIVAVGEAYEQHASCLNGIKSIQKNCGSEIEDLTIEDQKLSNPKFQILKDSAGAFRFHLKAANGEIIAQGEGYQTKEECLDAIEVIKKSCNAEIEDQSVLIKSIEDKINQGVTETSKVNSSGLLEKSRIVFVGNKMPMDYVMAIMTGLSDNNTNEIILKARGQAITTAVNVAEITRNRFLKDIKMTKIEIGTEKMLPREGETRSRMVSTIKITLTKGFKPAETPKMYYAEKAEPKTAVEESEEAVKKAAEKPEKVLKIPQELEKVITSGQIVGRDVAKAFGEKETKVWDEEKTKHASQPEERIINTSFASIDNAGADLEKKKPLFPNTNYYFTFDVGPYRRTSIGEPIPLQIEKLPKEAKIKIALFSYKGELEIFMGKDIGEMKVLPNFEVEVVQPVENPRLLKNDELLKKRLFFPIRTPNKEGNFRLRCNIYCQQTLVQSRLITAKVSNNITNTDQEMIISKLEYSMDKMLNPEHLSDIEPLGLSLMLNESSHGTHTFRVYTKGEKFDQDFEIGALKSLIEEARKSLKIIYWGNETDYELLKPQPTPRYGSNDKIDLEKIKKDLVLLAQKGNAFWLSLTQKIKTNYVTFRQSLKEPTSIEFVIKDASEAANYMFPAALIYDYPISLDTEEHFDLCSTFTDTIKRNEPLKDSPCFQGHCPNDTKPNVICPSGFWGFRHLMGIPLGSDSDQNKVIKYRQNPKITVAAYKDFSNWQLHQSALKLLDSNIQPVFTRKDVINELKSTSPHLVYFYCHGSEDKNLQYIRIGTKTEPKLEPTSLTNESIRWEEPRPMVFINGCHTVALKPELILTWATTFVASLNASGVMGTEITIFSSLATAYAEEWLNRFIHGEPAGKATLETRLKLLETGNPMGLVYNLYANAFLQLKKED
jgi:DNA-binding protein Alba